MREDVEIMGEEDVDPIQPEPLEGDFERAHDAVIGVVEDLLARRRLEELADPGALVGRAGAQQPADLRRDAVVRRGGDRAENG